MIGHGLTKRFVLLAAINITRPRFGGDGGALGHTSFLAYSPVPGLSAFYEIRLRFTLANNASATRDNLVLYSGQKGHGETPEEHKHRHTERSPFL